MYSLEVSFKFELPSSQSEERTMTSHTAHRIKNKIHVGCGKNKPVAHNIFWS